MAPLSHRAAITSLSLSREPCNNFFASDTRKFSTCSLSDLRWIVWIRNKSYQTRIRLKSCCTCIIIIKLEMWASAQRDGRPAEYRWRPLFNAAKFGSRPLLECRAVTLPRRQTRVGHGLDASMDWIGLDWMDWIGLDWIGSNVGKTWVDWIGLDCGEWMM